MKKATKKEMTIDELAQMVARGFARQSAEFGGFKNEMKAFKEETAENFKKVRRDILELNDRFVSKYEFDKLVSRFNILEAKVKSKK